MDSASDLYREVESIKTAIKDVDIEKLLRVDEDRIHLTNVCERMGLPTDLDKELYDRSVRTSKKLAAIKTNLERLDVPEDERHVLSPEERGEPNFSISAITPQQQGSMLGFFDKNDSMSKFSMFDQLSARKKADECESGMALYSEMKRQLDEDVENMLAYTEDKDKVLLEFLKNLKPDFYKITEPRLRDRLKRFLKEYMFVSQEKFCIDDLISLLKQLIGE